ncbi:hypothetical protein BDV25DRAFT_149906 [Aspergillus avenaceus]|uniref:Zn(2)-C6 fungal-type domain-containing protein n=1 Tax=Aspergillus avenaceus TaxID=36643 RepID=A0A5N6U4A3_ASPAV|nr:hypothetical protein BDV25DRAFT_149906 [Aspergillus avenaceus]
MVLDPINAQRQRAFHRRSRFGCRTCRARHVKCDETPGACVKCTSTGRTCEGYDIFPPRAVVTKVATPSQNLTLPGTSSGQRRWFHFFRNRTMPMLIGYYDSELWQQIVLQVSQGEPAVFHAVVALGVLQQDTEASRNRRGLKRSMSRDRYFALEQYSRSISILSQRLSSNDPLVREIALVCCLIFTLFEFVQDNYATALSHLESGLRILARQNGSEARSSISAGLYEHKANYCTMEDALARAFSRLDVQAAHFDSSSNTSLLPADINIADITYDRLDLRSIQDAKEKLDPIINNVFRFRTTCDTTLRDELGDHATLYVQHARMRANMKDHIMAFQRLISRSPPQTTRNIRSVDLILQHHLVIMVVLDTVLSLSEMVYDQYIPQMEKAVNISERIIDSMKAEYGPELPTILLDMGVILCLSWISLKCRDVGVRIRALNLLRVWPHREGPNVSTAFLCSCREAVEMEVDAADPVTGFIPELSRVRFISTQKSKDSHHAVLLYAMSDPEKKQLDVLQREFVIE